MSVQQTADRALLDLGKRLLDSGYQFITPSPLTHERYYQRVPVPQARDWRDVFGWSMPFDPELFSDEDRALLDRAGVIERQDTLWRSSVRWSRLGELLFVHSAWPTSDTDAVFFGPDSYRFAQAIDAQLQTRFAPVRRAVDIGCGSGIGAVVVGRSRRDAEVLAVDINPRALRLAAVNAELAGASNVSVYRSDVLASVEGLFDLIVANPPYMNDQQQRAYRHGGGTLGEGLSVRIVRESLPRLEVGGTLLVYTGVAIVAGQDPFRQAIEPMVSGEQYAWTYRELDPDVFSEELLKPGYERVERIAVVALTVTRER
ncbi:methyltransferase [Pseudomonas hamedanensis]|uniref:Class I SAM-dependent methyltransferase n=1 Tax=Pseudomonas hamedanensis TaxID=2745504 RepID=A0A9E6THP4_9PSED|nr:class I SAM-dependent methyltransferase [Pseudomonas hamedanensis]QXI18650.1 class I SAM-dependent methyltransferase [Pseudomonas hamedanensis]